MPRVVREASATWEGDLFGGVGTVTAATSGAFDAFAVTFPTRIGAPEGQTSPEELLAAAHASCFAMSLSNQLTQAGSPPARLDVRCAITLDEIAGEGHRIVGATLDVRGDAPGADAATFDAAVAAADAGCPFSALLRGAGATVEVTATQV